MRVTPVIRRLCFTGSAVALTLATLPATTQAQDVEDGRPAAWSGYTLADGVLVFTDQAPSMSPIVQLFYAGSPDAASQFTSGGAASARGASYWAGSGGSTIGSVPCLAGVPCPAGFPPVWPLAAFAAYPRTPDAVAPISGQPIGSDPLVVTPVEARAHATREYVEAVGAAANTITPVGPAQSVRATTHQTFEKGGVLVSRADSIVQDIDIAGTIHVDQVHTSVVVRTDGDKLLSDESTVAVSGLTIAGTPAYIDDQGIRFAGNGDNGAALAAANSALNTALNNAGLTVKLVGITRTKNPHRLKVEAGGIQVDWRQKAEGVPPPPVVIPCVVPDPQFPCVQIPNPNRTYFATAVFGNSSVTGYADIHGIGVRLPDNVIPNDTLPPPAPGTPPSVIAGGPPPALGPGPAVVAPAPGGDGAVRPRVIGGLLGGDSARRVKWLYLAGALLLIGSIASAFRSPTRRLRAG